MYLTRLVWVYMYQDTEANITNKPNYQGERNEAIYKDHLQGMTAIEIVLKYKITFTNFMRIIKQQKKLAKAREVKTQNE